MQLSFENVTKLYGPVIGVNSITCSIGPGVTGLLGTNGSGKSTLMNLAAGQLRPTQGRVKIGENAARSTRAKRDIGYCPDLQKLYEDLTGREFVYQMARLYGYRRAEAMERCERALSLTGMADRAGRKIAAASHGMRQRIKVAQALIHDPSILLLDEPLLGIDPGGRHEMHVLLQRLADEGRTVLLSTHILSEIDGLADSILMIAGGRMVAAGPLARIRVLLDDRPLLVLVETDEPRRMAQRLVEFPSVCGVEVRSDSLLARTNQRMAFFAAFNALVLEGNLSVRRFEVLDEGAEAVFGYLQSQGNS